MQPLTARKWFYPLVYAVLVVISMLPPITEIPYDPRHTQEVISAILMVALTPYRAWGWLFHLGTLVLVFLVALRPRKSGRVIAAYFGLNYLLIAGLQTSAQTGVYGLAVHSGAMLACGLLGLFNLSHWFSPDRVWMGVMHLPLLVMSLVALGLAHRGQKGAEE